MKYLIVVAVILLAYWLWRKDRRDPQARADVEAGNAKATAKQEGPQWMLRCAHCGVHLPQSDAVQGRQGQYCGLAHRLAKEG